MQGKQRGPCTGSVIFSMPIVFGFGELAYKKSVPTMKRKMNDQPDHSKPSGLAKYFTALTCIIDLGST